MPRDSFALRPPITLTGTDAADSLGFLANERGTQRGLGGDDTLTGGRGYDTLDGGDGADVIKDALFRGVESGRDLLLGGAGDDTIDAVGADTIDGGSGHDVAFVSLVDVTAGVTVTGAFGDSATARFSNGAVVSNVERVLLSTGPGDDALTLSEGADFAFAGAGADRVSGLGGNDKLFGEAGDDTLRGGTGDDTITGGAGADLLLGGDGADLFIFDAAGAGTGLDTLRGFDAAAGDRVQLDVDFYESVIDAADPFGDGFVRVRDVAGGAVLEVDLNGGGDSYVTLALFKGVGAAALGTDFLLG